MTLVGGIVEPAVPAIQRFHPIRTHLGRSIAALMTGLVVAGVTAVALDRFYDSLGVVGNALTAWAVGLIALAVAVTVVLAACGSMAVARSLRAARLSSTDRVAARASGAAATDWTWYVGGLSISALVLAFLAFFLSANDGAVREQYLNWDAIDEFLPTLWKGLWLNIKVFIVAEILVLIWGLVLALARIFPGKAGRPVRFLAVA
jgi:polar amino acid transport system permease protein